MKTEKQIRKNLKEIERDIKILKNTDAVTATGFLLRRVSIRSAVKQARLLKWILNEPK